MSPLARLSLIERAAPELSIAAQCRLLKLARSTLYHRPAPVSADDLRVMRRLDEQLLGRLSSKRPPDGSEGRFRCTRDRPLFASPYHPHALSLVCTSAGCIA